MARPAEYRVRIEVLEDGSLKNRRVERYAIFLADEVPDAESWRLSAGRDVDNNYSYRRRVEDDGNFKRRLADLRAEKEELVTKAKDPFAPLIWQAQQSYRLAVAAGDQKEMRSCTELCLKLVERQQAANGGSAPAPDRMPRGPGAPANEAPTTASSPSMFKAMLKAKGVATPKVEAVEDDAA